MAAAEEDMKIAVVAIEVDMEAAVVAMEEEDTETAVVVTEAVTVGPIVVLPPLPQTAVGAMLILATTREIIAVAVVEATAEEDIMVAVADVVLASTNLAFMGIRDPIPDWKGNSFNVMMSKRLGLTLTTMMIFLLKRQEMISLIPLTRTPLRLSERG